MQATRNGVRVGELRDPDSFAAKLRILNEDGARRFGDRWQYDVEADVAAYIDIAKKANPPVPQLFSSTSASLLPRMLSLWGKVAAAFSDSGCISVPPALWVDVCA